MEEEKKIEVLITIKNRFVSVNSLYKTKVVYSGGRPVASLYKNPDATRVELEVRDQLRAVDFSDYIDWLKTGKKFDLKLSFVLNRNSNKLDCSNLTKNVEDIWVRFVREDLGISEYDDRLHLTVYVEKSFIPNAKSEYVYLTLSKSKGNYRFDIIPKPENIWFGSDKKFEIPPLPKRKKKDTRYFSEVPKEDADTYVYILDTSENIPFETISKIQLDLFEIFKRGSGFLYVGLLGDKEILDSRVKEEIMFLKSQIEEAEKIYSGVNFKEIKDINELKNLL